MKKIIVVLKFPAILNARMKEVPQIRKLLKLEIAAKAS